MVDVSNLAMTLLSGLGGGILRVVPELIAFFNKKADNSHELAMMDKQIELQKMKGADDRALVAAQGEQTRATVLTEGEIKTQLSQLDAIREALKDQMQKTGFFIIDCLNFLVRPITTYYYLGLYGFVKYAMIQVAMQQADKWGAVKSCWSAEDAAVLAGILSFWFVGRVFDKKK